MYMDNLTNKEPGIKDTAVQDSANREQKKREGRSVIGAKAQTILDFLRGCSPYEADSIRVMVGHGTGDGLSEGQAQRISIARALLRPGRVLLLDEPTSSLDGETERLLLERLSGQVRDRTVILVTHRETAAALCGSAVHVRRIPGPSSRPVTSTEQEHDGKEA